MAPVAPGMDEDQTPLIDAEQVEGLVDAIVAPVDGWQLFGNPVVTWLICAGIALGVFMLTATIRRVLVRRVTPADPERAPTGIVLLAGLAKRTRHSFLAVLGLGAGALPLALPAAVDTAIIWVVSTVAVVQLALWASYAYARGVDRYQVKRLAHDPTARTTVGAVTLLGKTIIWSIALLVLLDNSGIDVTALVAGLGVGGIAVAFAAQSLLADLFASVSILLDKPFVVGDFIIVGDFLGEVEKVGIKTTRLRSLGGEQIIMANNDLLSSRIRNYKRMYERRVAFTFNIAYETEPERLERVPVISREVIEALPQTRFDRAHFKAYGEFSLVFEVVYYVLDPDYNLFMDKQQAVNFGLFRRFHEAGIRFAYPTQRQFNIDAGDDRATAAPAPIPSRAHRPAMH
ncbi:MAG: mechanosensitive ion channel family protein [Caenispirillum sp.]|nr:mechanosensitive ion channel family protein [Caenispirillum sp.]